MSSGVDELDGRIQAYIEREVRADGWVFDEEDEAAFGRLALERDWGHRRPMVGASSGPTLILKPGVRLFS